MARIVSDKRVDPVVSNTGPKTGAAALGWSRRSFCVGWKGPKFEVYGRQIVKVEENLEVVRRHFDVNRTDAFRIALHLVASAVKAGRLAL